jgi:hypothetical protein
MERHGASGVAPWLRLPFLLLETERVCFCYRYAQTNNAAMPERGLVVGLRNLGVGRRSLPAPRGVGEL